MDTLYSPDFQHPDTGVPICFVLDLEAEILWLEPCEVVCEQWDISEADYEETERLCKLWGEHSCYSIAEANPLIRSRYNEAFEDGVCFSEK